MRAISLFAGVVLLAVAPRPASAAVTVVADPQSRTPPQFYWVIRSDTADDYAGRPQLLVRKMPQLGYGPHPIGRPASLRTGGYYIYPVCAGIGIWPEGRWPARNGDPAVRLKCP